MSIPQLSLDQLLFPIVEVRTNGAHNPAGDLSGTQLQYSHQVQKLENQQNRYGLAVNVRSDNEKSTNPPYQFVIEAYAIFVVNGGSDENDANALLALRNGLPMVMGAIRERLAEISSRAPWGRFLINTVGLPEETGIRYL